MNSKHRKTLERIFDKPIRNNIKWSDVEKFIPAVGGTIQQGAGSRIRIVVGEISLNIHTPHPGNELKPYQVRAIQQLLKDGGIQP